jgi:mono/diheme cytochrome c family protein
MKTIVVGFMMCLCVGTAHADELYKQGKDVFAQAQPSCAICHTLADAGSAGAIGPNLNELKPSEEQVWTALNGGVGIMPDFSDSLSQEQMKAVAHYVAEASKQ